MVSPMTNNDDGNGNNGDKPSGEIRQPGAALEEALRQFRSGEFLQPEPPVKLEPKDVDEKTPVTLSGTALFDMMANRDKKVGDAGRYSVHSGSQDSVPIRN